ncbi:hypothetical protein D8I35_10200 [Corticibacter populi]|uniref:Uncharacterized protein n=1 Tax=Corticibacter populi TaxID=1550736 RepID=A0A3M6QV49_9BURK|nr:tetratricopeptide repeat protein [Corticibacter populi]RMX06853.1 hypothetical protein D8I35_10200 [Corticibacter populi]RZS31556.1 tetratricopeptide repeat protein [Corticibacter populi]
MKIFLTTARWMLLAACTLQLTACGGITLQTAGETSTRNLATPVVKTQASTAEPQKAPVSAADGLKLARLLRDQGRYEAAAGVYGQLEQRGDLQPLELLEYASVAARVQTPQESLALYGRARRALEAGQQPVPAAARANLCNGLGRARMATGQRDAALADFDCALAADPDNVTALNAKGVLLDARGEHTQAQQLLTRASELDPADFRILNNLALSHLSSGDTAQAIRLLSQIEAPQWPTLKLNLAFAQSMTGDDTGARKTLTTIMTPALAGQALADFSERRARIAAGASVAEELLAASRQLLPLREAGSQEGDRG